MIERHWLEKIITRKFDYIITGCDIVAAIALIKALSSKKKKTLWIYNGEDISLHLTDLLSSKATRNYLEKELGLLETNEINISRWLEIQLTSISQDFIYFTANKFLFLDYKNAFIEIGKVEKSLKRDIHEVCKKHFRSLQLTLHVISMEKTFMTSITGMEGYLSITKHGENYTRAIFDKNFEVELIGGSACITKNNSTFTRNELLEETNNSISSIVNTIKTIA
ncbi:hypothetical protein [Photobacterium kishitanii]|uniref:Uncharacterized protein n=1 Tax=Photobacterium kishitanii TaxID=318456 RepID=A0A2T3KMM2_9GAMM|nr:hypothetical protein [Photobacterium kishitanii]PSV01050.1 hypothetical protein C9J27_03260 [Photobacterium kishitanii]